jgi:hypothetical protein
MEVDNEVISNEPVSDTPPASAPADSGSFDSGPSEAPEPKSVREHLTDGFARARARMGLDDDTQAAPPAEKKVRRVREKTDGGQVAARDPNSQASVSTPARGTESSVPPAAWSKSAKDKWASLPPEAQAAVSKREKDVEQGVAKLREYYSGIDNVLGRYDNEIKQLGLPHHQVVDNLFGWMKAVHGNPVEAIPALMASYNFPPQVIAGVVQKLAARLPRRAQAPAAQAAAAAQGQGQAEGQAQGQAGQPQISPEVVQYLKAQQMQLQAAQQRIDQLTNAFQHEVGGIKGVFEQQSQAHTNAYLADWAKDKPYFEEVRQHMARLVSPDPTTGESIIPLKDGRVDLEAAYDYAIYALPEVRAKVLAAQQASAQQARQAKAQNQAFTQTRAANEAIRKRVSVTSAAPGGQPQPQVKKGVSVRDSLRAALQEHSNRA